MVGSETQRGISGGEMKRTAIGMALVTDPGMHKILYSIFYSFFLISS